MQIFDALRQTNQPKYSKRFTEPVLFRAWTPTEDKKLLELYNEYGPTWEKLGSVLHRTRFSVQRRFLILQNSERNEFIENNADAREIWDEGETITITGKWNEVETSKLYSMFFDQSSSNTHNHSDLGIVLKFHSIFFDNFYSESRL